MSYVIEGGIMRKRLLVCLIFGATGLATALPIGNLLGLSTIQAFIGCTAAGVVLGYLVSVLLDIFVDTSSTGIEN